MTIINIHREALLTLLRETVKCKILYWDALRELEVAIAPEGEFSDRANNEILASIDMMAAGLDTPEQALSWVEHEHLNDVLETIQRYP